MNDNSDNSTNEVGTQPVSVPKKSPPWGLVAIIVAVVVIGTVITLTKMEIIGNSEHTIHTEGIHIMEDGSVMQQDGTELESAEVMPDGTIKLPNGEIVVPTMDLRIGVSDDDHEHESGVVEEHEHN